MSKVRILAKNVNKMSRADWLDLRRTGIGGSDAAAICGENPWRSSLSVWLSKVGGAPEVPATEAMEWGIELEEPIAKRFAKKTGMKVRRSNLILQHAEHDWMLANVDRLVRDPEEKGWGIMEVKNTGERQGANWADGAIPVYYEIQGQHYLAVTGLDYCWFVPLIGGQRMAPVKMHRNERFITSLIKIERDFWQLVLDRKAPPIDDSTDAARVLKWLYPTSKKEAVVIDEDLYLKLKSARERKVDAEREERGYENQIKDAMKTAEVAMVPGNPKPLVTWKTGVRRSLDVTALEIAEPEIAMKYRKETPTRTFLVK